MLKTNLNKFETFVSLKDESHQIRLFLLHSKCI